MTGAKRHRIIGGMPDPDLPTVDEEPDEEPCFDVHAWYEAYLAQDQADVTEELVGVPLN